MPIPVSLCKLGLHVEVCVCVSEREREIEFGTSVVRNCMSPMLESIDVTDVVAIFANVDRSVRWSPKASFIGGVDLIALELRGKICV